MPKPRYHLNVRCKVEEIDGGFYVTCPDLPGIHISVEHEDEINNAVEDSVRAYVAMTIRHNDPFPQGIIVKEHSLLNRVLEKVNCILKAPPSKPVGDFQIPIFQTT